MGALLTLNRAVINFFKANRMMAPFADPVAGMVKDTFVLFQDSGLYAPGLGKRFYLPPDPDLSDGGAIITGFDVVTSEQNSVTPPPAPARDPIAASVLKNLSLVVMDSENQQIAWIPLTDIYNQNALGKIFKTYIPNMSFQNSFIDINTNSGITASNAVWLKVFYTEKQ